MNQPTMAERTLAASVPGGELIAVRSGSGRPLLVLHGGPAVNDCSDWFVGELAGWDALLFAQRGVGPSLTENLHLRAACVRRAGQPGNGTAHYHDRCSNSKIT